jgi:hypothetical protein
VRFVGLDIVCNSDMRVEEVRKFHKLDEMGESLVRAMMSQLNFIHMRVLAGAQAGVHDRCSGGVAAICSMNIDE